MALHCSKRNYKRLYFFMLFRTLQEKIWSAITTQELEVGRCHCNLLLISLLLRTTHKVHTKQGIIPLIKLPILKCCWTEQSANKLQTSGWFFTSCVFMTKKCNNGSLFPRRKGVVNVWCQYTVSGFAPNSSQSQLAMGCSGSSESERHSTGWRKFSSCAGWASLYALAITSASLNTLYRSNHIHHPNRT